MKKIIYIFLLILSFSFVFTPVSKVFAVEGDGYSEIGGSGKKSGGTGTIGGNKNPAPTPAPTPSPSTTEATTEATTTEEVTTEEEIKDIIKDIITIEQDSQLVISINTKDAKQEYIFISPDNSEIKDGDDGISLKTIENNDGATKIYNIAEAKAGTWKVKYQGEDSLDFNVVPVPIEGAVASTEEITTEATTEVSTENITSEASTEAVTTEVTTEASTEEENTDKTSNKNFASLLIISYIICAIVFFLFFKIKSLIVFVVNRGTN